MFDLLLLEQTLFSSLDIIHKVFCQLISYILHPDTSYSNIILLSYDLPKTVKIATLMQCTVPTHRVMNFWCYTKLIATWWGTTFGKTPWPYLVTQRLGIEGRLRKSGTTGAGPNVKKFLNTTSCLKTLSYPMKETPAQSDVRVSQYSLPEKPN